MTSEDFLRKICTSHFIVRVRKGLLRSRPRKCIGNSTCACTGVFASCVLRNICVVVLVAPNTECGGLQWHQFKINLYLFLFCRWMRSLRPEDRAEISLKYPDLQSARCPVAHCDEIPVPIFGEFLWRFPWCSRYRRRKWTRRYEFKSWTILIAFHIALIPLGKVWIQLFSLQLWVSSRTD